MAPDELATYYLPDYDVEAGLEVLRKVRKVPSGRELNQHIQAELQMLDQLRPNVVVNDFRLTTYISARRCGIPVVSLVGGRYLYQYASKPFKAPRTHPSYPLLRWIIGERGTDALVPNLQRWALRYKMRPFYHLSKRYGVEPKKELWDLLIGEYNLILDTELLGPTKPLPENFRRVGPINWTPQIPLPEWVHAIDRAQPVLYVTMGSTGHPALFRHLIRMLGGAPYTVMMSTGGQFQVDNDAWPSNFRVAKFVPGDQVMELADLVIFHGGAGTGYQAIGAGKPAIVIATHLEQEFVGQVFEEHGAGLFWTMHQVMRTPSLIRSSVETILSNLSWYRGNMERLRRDVLQYNPVEMAADCIERFVLDRLQRS